LDVFGNAEKVGKQHGGDIISNKKTWLLLQALQTANVSQKKELKGWLQKKDFNPAEKVNAVKDIFVSLNLDKVLKEQIDLYYTKAISFLKTSSAPSQKTETFISFAKTLMQRTN
jgi:geranylgeranyl diphosphate synthase type II